MFSVRAETIWPPPFIVSCGKLTKCRGNLCTPLKREAWNSMEPPSLARVSVSFGFVSTATSTKPEPQANQPCWHNRTPEPQHQSSLSSVPQSRELDTVLPTRKTDIERQMRSDRSSGFQNVGIQAGDKAGVWGAHCTDVLYWPEGGACAMVFRLGVCSRDVDLG